MLDQFRLDSGIVTTMPTAIALLLMACAPDKPDASPEPTPPDYVGVAVCAGCHSDEYERWRNSHHDLAMQHATDDTVLGDFDGAGFRYGGVESTFYRRGGNFFVTTDSASGALVEYRIAYTFGVEPLQQYLVEFPDGRLQALGISWDSRSADEGGQRWFHIYPDDAVDHDDLLHWTGPLQNWNFMCAECHSTNVRKNYTPENDSFSTTWSEINVACEACHGPGSAHVAAAVAPGGENSSVLAFDDAARWVMNMTTGIAERVPSENTSLELETCARCHSRRAIFSENYVHSKPLADTHRPALLTEELYYADGQIKDEVYVYGSFLQSAMHGAGVSCSDCHDAHSLKLKAPGNGVCAQCHLPAVFDVTAHHRHARESTGAACVNCHMASRNYMVIDGRRDHSFRIPRPDLTVSIDTPNACNGCHVDQSAEWAATNIKEWYGGPPARHYGEIIDAARRGTVGASKELAALASDEQMPAIARATAVALLATNADTSATVTLESAAIAEDALIRMAAADSASVLDTPGQVRIVAPLLRDPVRAVRLAAAGTLLHAPPESFLQSQSEDLLAAIDEYRKVQALNSDRAESHVNLGVLHALEGDFSNAEEGYNRAVEMMPDFAAAYINLADLYREAGREDDVDASLHRGLAVLPGNPDLHHALGLSLVRRGDYGRSIATLRKAHELEPTRARFAYVLGIALNSTGSSDEALAVLHEAHERHPGNRELLFALSTISRDSGQLTRAKEYATTLLALSPNDPSVLQLLTD